MEGKKFGKSGFCKECSTWVFLKEDGSCEFGHSRESITKIASFQEKTKEEKSQKTPAKQFEQEEREKPFLNTIFSENHPLLATWLYGYLWSMLIILPLSLIYIFFSFLQGYPINLTDTLKGFLGYIFIASIFFAINSCLLCLYPRGYKKKFEELINGIKKSCKNLRINPYLALLVIVIAFFFLSPLFPLFSVLLLFAAFSFFFWKGALKYDAGERIINKWAQTRSYFFHSIKFTLLPLLIILLFLLALSLSNKPFAEGVQMTFIFIIIPTFILGFPLAFLIGKINVTLRRRYAQETEIPSYMNLLIVISAITIGLILLLLFWLTILH